MGHGDEIADSSPAAPPENSDPEPDIAEDDQPDPATFVWPEQSIPQHIMVAGLLAASRIRPPGLYRADKPQAPVPALSSDPWVQGIDLLQRMLALEGFSPTEWRRVQIGCASLLAGWGDELRRLGWTTEEAFGAHPDEPATAIRNYGLGLLVGDGKVVELTAAGALIELPSGVHQTFTRRPNAWAVPVWHAGQGHRAQRPGQSFWAEWLSTSKGKQ